MSFILDALKKSENERQQQSSAEFSNVPASAPAPNPARWLWMLGFLLAINFAILLGILLRTSSKDEAPPVATTVEAVAEETAPATDDFEQQVAMAMDNRAAAAPVEQENAAPVATATTTPTPSSSSRVSEAVVPTVDELRLEGTLQIAQLHLDIHVYSEQPEERFVFINMKKHREGSQTPEGPVIREIRSDGVLLEHEGRVFLLPRE